MPPSAPVKVCRFPPELTLELDAAVCAIGVAAAAAFEAAAAATAGVVEAAAAPPIGLAAKLVEIPRPELNASAAAPVLPAASAAASALLQAVTVAADALHLDDSCPQMKLAMILISKAEPWLKSLWFSGSKESELRPSKPKPN